MSDENAVDLPLLTSVPNGIDITQCTGGNCPHRFLCFRYLAEPIARQVYFNSPPYAADGQCAQYWDAREKFRVLLNRKAIENYARKLSQQNIKQSDLYWMLAEMQLWITGFYDAKWDLSNQAHPKIRKSTYPENYIRDHAYYLWRNHQYTTDDLYWLLAEQRLLDQAIIERIYALLPKEKK